MNTIPVLANLLPVILAVFGVLVLLVIGLIFVNFLGLWIQAKAAGTPVSFLNLVFMRFRKVHPATIVNSRITAAKAGLDYTTDQLEAHYLAGGDIINVVLALVAAEKAGISLSFDRACAIDLATKDTGKTVLEAVRTSINPKVIDCPNPTAGITKITAVAKDGIGVNVRARVTVRTNLDRFV
ncbi:MAG: flotillin-like FloA family protein, partial [Akkermansiaceae bacterium]|nr:flotillin-like FloA family protein [Akkermansiaceae bacterium]